jgi:hypothetical protein
MTWYRAGAVRRCSIALEHRRPALCVFVVPCLGIHGQAFPATVLCVNFIGDGLRDALDPRAIER